MSAQDHGGHEGGADAETGDDLRDGQRGLVALVFGFSEAESRPARRSRDADPGLPDRGVRTG
ncbi:hypothetical protein ABZV80_41065 [Streptomyces sp. NPDC005132]|uniref:hypothetical protein n=1 Tax=Streptomyces sp. NPDC005132 TaxID=3154294 RepID=UPI0033B45F70